MLFPSHRTSCVPKIPAKTVERVTKIRELLGRTLVQVREQHKRTGKSPSSLSAKRKSDQSSECETIQEILVNLRRGYLMTKHSESIEQPHDKFVYVSEDGRFLCWKSLEKDDEKKLELNTITKVVKEGAEFHIKANKIKDVRRCVVILAPSRNLQLEAASEMEAEYFRYQLDRFVKYSKGMHLNYRYCQP